MQENIQLPIQIIQTKNTLAITINHPLVEDAAVGATENELMLNLKANNRVYSRVIKLQASIDPEKTVVITKQGSIFIACYVEAQK